MPKRQRSSSAKRSKGSKPRPAARSQADSPSPLQFVTDLFAKLPEGVQQALLEEMMGQPESFFDDSLAIPDSPVQELIEEARHQPTPTRSITILQEAEQAARKALGRQFQKLAGRFGATDAGMDYLDVKAELAAALAAEGHGERAVAHAEEALRLDPTDPAGVRRTLLAEYLSAGRDSDADALLRERCPESWPEWHYGRLLLELRRHVRAGPVDELLRQAHRQNPFVLPLLLGERMPDARPKFSMGPSDEGAAHFYAADFLRVWRETPGAVSWLREAAARLKLDMPRADEEDAVLPPSRAEIAALSLHPESTWVVGVHEAGQLLLPEMDRPKKHWLLYAVAHGGRPIGFDFVTRKPRAGDVWKLVLDTMRKQQPPARPQTLLAASPELERRLRRDAARTGIEVGLFDDPQGLAQIFDRLVERFQGGQAQLATLDPGAIQNAPLNPDEVWEAAVVQLPHRIQVGGRSVRPSAALVMNRRDGTILWHELFTEPPAGALDTAVRMAIARPAVGSPRRPRQVVVRDHDEAVSLRALGDEAGFQCDAAPPLKLIELAVDDMGKTLFGDVPPIGLADVQGLTLAEQERFYAAAAEFYRARPWKRYGMDEIVAVQPVEPAGSTLYGVVMGQSGMTLGIALYYRLDDIRDMFAEPEFDEPAGRDSLTVIFGEEADVPPADLDAIEQFGWPIAAPEGYPTTMRVCPGPEIENPTIAEFRLLIAALEGTTRLAQTSDREIIVATAGIEVKVRRLGTIWEL